eukprot:5827433-Prymnesium_polylepis.2
MKYNRPYGLLDARQITGMLLELCCSSTEIAQLFGTFSSDGQMSSHAWRRFVLSEQLWLEDDQSAAASSAVEDRLVEGEKDVLEKAEYEFGCAALVGDSLDTDATINFQQFAQQLILCKRNHAIASASLQKKAPLTMSGSDASAGRFDCLCATGAPFELWARSHALYWPDVQAPLRAVCRTIGAQTTWGEAIMPVCAESSSCWSRKGSSVGWMKTRCKVTSTVK